MTLRARGERNEEKPDALPVYGVNSFSDGEMLIVTTCRLMWVDERYVYSGPEFVKDEVSSIHAVTAKLDEIYERWQRDETR
jgi:hypothetical protein